MKFLYATDIHGDTGKLRAIFNVARSEGIQYVSLGADLLPKYGDSWNRCEIQRDYILKDLKWALESFRRAYPYSMVFGMLGNDDLAANEQELALLKPLIYPMHLNAESTGSVKLVGMGFVPPTPFSFKDYERWDTKPRKGDLPVCTIGVGRTSIISDPKSPTHMRIIGDPVVWFNKNPSIEQELNGLKPKGSPDIYMFHAPPRGTGLDCIYERDKFGTPVKVGVGSKAVLKFIKNTQPKFVFCGHIHESPGVVYVDQTICVNPGQDDSCPYAIIDTDECRAVLGKVY